MKRKYSDKFIEEKIKKIDNLHAKAQEQCVMLPDALDREEYKWLRKQVMEYVQHRVDRSYVEGFWHGWTLKEGDPNKH